MERRRLGTLTAAATVFFVVLPFAAPLGNQAAAAGAPVQVRVGVILDMASAAAARFQAGIRMAVEDYYSSYPSSTTRVELHFADSSGDALGAASAAVDLISNAKVQAIIGPQTSEEAEFVARIGSRATVPVLSFSATSPALSPSRSGAPFLVRTGADDAFQAAAIADVVRSFAWREAVLVHGDSRFDAAIVPALDDALRGAGAAVAHREALPAGASDDRLDAVLYRVKALTTSRVFIVHTSPSLAPRLFRRAKKAGMMSDGYVWIATAGVGGEVDTLSPEDIDAVQGVVCVRPYVQPTSKAKDFTERFKARMQRENPRNNQNTYDSTVSTLWAYDTAWAVAAAAEAAGVSGPAFRPPLLGTTAPTGLDQLGVSATGAAFLKAVLGTTFDGLAGEFKLVEGQLQMPSYEIVNVVGHGTATVGIWRAGNGISQERDANGGHGLNQIFWPGASLSDVRIPRGGAVSPIRRELVIAVPVKHGFQQFVEVSNGTGGRTKITGFCIDVFDAAIKGLPYHVNYRYVPIANADSYDQLIQQVPQQKADAVVGDVEITASRMAKVEFTMPFTETGWSMVTVAEPQCSTSMFFFLKPLTPALWSVSFAAFVFTAFVIWVIEHRINPEFRGSRQEQFGTIFFYGFSTLFYAQRENVQSNLSKFLMVIWLFAVLILTSSYTASLTSMLTVQKLNPVVTEMNDLITSGDYVGYQEGSYVADELVKMNFTRSKLRSYKSPKEYADALSKGSANGGVAAVFDELPYLKVFLSEYCEGYTMAGPVYKGIGFGFAFAKGSPIALEVSRSVVGLTDSNDMAMIERKWFGTAAAGGCRDGESSAGLNLSLSLWNFTGLFIITGAASTLMFAVYFLMFVYRERHELGAAVHGAGGVPLNRLRAWLQHYDRKDLTAPSFKQ
ncbi:hypothetical protein ACP4OV_000804 [Aristida adscensionis]